MHFDRGAIVVAPFRFTDGDTYKVRPVLVVSRATVYAETGHVMALMITAAERSHWPLDVPITDWIAAGLTKPCLVRLKMFTIDVRAIKAQVGTMDRPTMDQVQFRLTSILA